MIRSCLIDIIYGTYQPSRKTATILVNVDATATHRQSVLRAQLCRDIAWVEWASCPYCLSRLTRIRRSVAKWRNQIARSARGHCSVGHVHLLLLTVATTTWRPRHSVACDFTAYVAVTGDDKIPVMLPCMTSSRRVARSHRHDTGSTRRQLSRSENISV